MWEWLKRLFGFGKKEPERPRVPDKVEPPPDIPSRSAGEGLPDRPPEPAPAPPEPTPSVPEPGAVHSLPDRLTVDGEEVDSYLSENGVLVVTQLKTLQMGKGQAGKLVCVVEAEPLTDPADREKLRLAMAQNAPHMHYAGTHELIVTAMPIRTAALLISQPTHRPLEGEAHMWIESKAKDRVHLKLFFPGDDPARIEITIPFTTVTGELEDWVFPYFEFAWSSRREHYTDTRNHRRETGKKVVEIA